MNPVFARLKALLPKGSFARNVALLAGGTAVGQAIVVLASPILTRLYTPGDFGVLAVYSSLLGILSTVAALRYELAIPLAEKDEDAAALVVLSLVIVVGISMMVVVGVGIWGDKLSHAFYIGKYIWLLPIGLGAVGVYQIFNYWAIRRRLFKYISRTKINQGLAMVSTQLCLGTFTKGPFGLLLGSILGGVVGTITLSRSYRKAGLKPTFSMMRYMAARYIRFPLMSSFASLLNSGALQLPPLLFVWLYGPTVAGWFALVQRVMGAPMALIGQAVAQVYLGEASCLVRNSDFGSLKTQYLKLTYRLLLIALIPAVLMGLGGRPIFSWIFGFQWEEAGFYAQLLALMFALQLVSAPLSQTMNMLSKQHWQLMWDGGRFIGVVFVFFTAHRLGFPAYKTVAAYGGTVMVMYLFLWYLGWAALQSRRV